VRANAFFRSATVNSPSIVPYHNGYSQTLWYRCPPYSNTSSRLILCYIQYEYGTRKSRYST
jgi:hypothetical protein